MSRTRFTLGDYALASGLQNDITIRNARIAPTIAGRGQAEAGYLACRFFKNISYGQFCLSNVPLACDVLENQLVFLDDIQSGLQELLSKSAAIWKDTVRFQQEKVKLYTIYHIISIYQYFSYKTGLTRVKPTANSTRR